MYLDGCLEKLIVCLPPVSQITNAARALFLSLVASVSSNCNNTALRVECLIAEANSTFGFQVEGRPLMSTSKGGSGLERTVARTTRAVRCSGRVIQGPFRQHIAKIAL